MTHSQIHPIVVKIHTLSLLALAAIHTNSLKKLTGTQLEL